MSSDSEDEQVIPRGRERKEERPCHSHYHVPSPWAPGSDVPAAGTYLELHRTVEVNPQHLLDRRDDVLLHGSSGQHCKAKPTPEAVSGMVNNAGIALLGARAEPGLCRSIAEAPKIIFF